MSKKQPDRPETRRQDAPAERQADKSEAEADGPEPPEFQLDHRSYDYDGAMVGHFRQADPELGDAVGDARQAGVSWKSILGVVLPLVRDEALAALKKILERVGSRR